MTGINTTLDIAKQAIAANQYGLSVTGQNIANVDNTSYSRQLVELQNGTSVKIGDLVFGTGVDVTQISAAVDDLLQAWLYDQTSTANAYGQMASNLSYIEDIYNLDSENSLDSLFSEFWNSWSELSNNPTGTAERSGVLESGEAIVEQLNDMGDSLNALSATVNNRIEVAVDSVNSITAQIDELNNAITAIEAQEDAIANDLRDERSALVTELASLLDITTYEQNDGSLLVTTANGSAILVGSGGSRELSVSQGQVMWKSSGGSVDISDQISGGSIGGWLDIRDEVIPEYQAELDALTEAFIWNVNYQHSQGAGLTYFDDTVTGSYAVDTTTTNQLDTLDYFDNVDLTEPFSIWIADSSSGTTVYSETTVDFSALDGTSTMADVAATFNSAVTGVTASVVDGAIVFTPDSTDYQFAFGGDDSGLAAALGINTFFTGSSIEDIGVNTQVSDTDLIAAGQLDDTTGEIAAGDNSNAHLLAECGELRVEIDTYSFDRTSDTPATVATITTTTDGYYETMVSNLGIVTDSVARNLETAESLLAELQEQRDTVSAVSLDEEMINLVKYQNAYNAASKLLTVADEMLDAIISTR
jgi:flagellar hook-associated protein 1 FlgK